MRTRRVDNGGARGGEDPGEEEPAEEKRKAKQRSSKEGKEEQQGNRRRHRTGESGTNSGETTDPGGNGQGNRRHTTNQGLWAYRDGNCGVGHTPLAGNSARPVRQGPGRDGLSLGIGTEIPERPSARHGWS